MLFTPYDWNQHLQHKSEYVEDRLCEGSPVVGISFDEGVLLATVRKTQRKIFEIYDRLMYSAIGNQADIESIRIASIDFAHQEGYSRSPDDVTVQRLAGFAISPAIKRAYNDAGSGPYVLRALFVELGKTPDTDIFLTINYDGEFTSLSKFAVIAGSATAGDAMSDVVGAGIKDETPDLNAALEIALHAWVVGHVDETPPDETSSVSNSAGDWRGSLKHELQGSVIEAATLERHTKRERRFRLLNPQDLSAIFPS